MEKFKYLIVGGGIAGTTAAETIRQNDRDGSIAIVSDEPHIFYSRLMISKTDFLLGRKPADNVWLKDQNWYGASRIAFIGGRSAVKLNVAEKTLVLDDGRELSYEKLLLAIGAHARKWNVVGADKEGIYYLRTLDEAKALAAAIPSKKHAVLIGSSAVSFEAAEVLHQGGIRITEVMLERHFWEPMLDEKAGKMVEKSLAENGLEIMRQSEVQEVLGEKTVSGVRLKDGRKLECDMVICGIGVIFPIAWIKEAGISANRGISVNEYLETNVQDIWAAGDIAEVNDVILKETVQFGNWMSAREQGRVAGLNMTGKKDIFKLVSFYISHGFGLSVTFIGDIRILPDRTVIERGSPEINSYAKFIVRDGRMIGATLVNRIQEMGPITKIITAGADMSAKQKELADPGIKLETFIS
jgi:NAD(P)H-nitrite reductase large subunit